MPFSLLKGCLKENRVKLHRHPLGMVTKEKCPYVSSISLGFLLRKGDFISVGINFHRGSFCFFCLGDVLSKSK